MKTLLVTGGTGDLGGIVIEWLRRDYNCVLVTREMADATNAAQMASAVDALVKQHGAPYGLVHLVGAFAMGNDAETWARMMAVNATAAAAAFNAIIPHLENSGRIVAISAYAALTKPKGMAAYVASKAALNALVEVLAADLLPRGITVNALLPMAMDTPANSGGNLVPRADVAEAIRWLLTEAAGSTTGALIPLRR